MLDTPIVAIIGGCLALSAIGFAAAALLLLRGERDAPDSNALCLDRGHRMNPRARVCRFCGANIV